MSHLTDLPVEDALKKIRETAEAATPGPWGFDTDDLGTWINLDEQEIPVPIAKMGKSTKLPTQANAAFIALAPEAIGYLLRLVDEYKTISNKLASDYWQYLQTKVQKPRYELLNTVLDIDKEVQSRLKDKA